MKPSAIIPYVTYATTDVNLGAEADVVVGPSAHSVGVHSGSDAYTFSREGGLYAGICAGANLLTVCILIKYLYIELVHTSRRILFYCSIYLIYLNLCQYV